MGLIMIFFRVQIHMSFIILDLLNIKSDRGFFVLMQSAVRLMIYGAVTRVEKDIVQYNDI